MIDKIISYNQLVHNVDIISEKDILLPANLFKFSIPAVREKEINIFEETILKLSDIESSNTQNLADITCLDKELVLFIQYKLQQLGLLTERFELTDTGKDRLQQLNQPKFEITAANIFVNLLDGSIFPVIIQGGMKFETIEENRGSTVAFRAGTTGDKKKIIGKKIPLNTEKFYGTVPNPNDVIKTIRRFKKLYKSFRLLSNMEIEIPKFSQKVEAISIEPIPELVFLHCKLIIKKGTSDIFVTDPFGFSFSENLKTALDKTNENFLIEFKENALHQKIDNHNHNKNYLLTSFSDSINLYPEVRGFLIIAEKNFNTAEQNQNVSTSNEEREFKTAVGKTIEALYDAIEWCFRYIVKENPVDSWEKIFCSSSTDINNDLLNKFAKKIGFDVSNVNSNLLRVTPGKIKAFSNGTVEMQPLLALAITGAANNNLHPLHRLTHSYPSFITFLSILKKSRNREKHGSISEKIESFEQLTEIKNVVYNTIKTLFPNVIPKVSADSNELDNGYTDIDQEMLKANVKLEKYFGYQNTGSMKQNIKELLLKIELNSNDYSEVINLLCSALQNLFFNFVSDNKIFLENKSDFKSAALRNSIDANFDLIDNEIPKAIACSKKEFIKQACNNGNCSLQANLMAFLIVIPQKMLMKVSKNVSNMIVLVDILIKFRGHGNKTSKQIEKEFNNEKEFLDLKENVYKIIKTLMEI